MLQQEFEYFIDNQNELVNRYNGKYIVIKNREVIGAFATEWDAYINAIKDHEVGTFLIQQCVAGESAYMVHFHSPLTVAIA